MSVQLRARRIAHIEDLGGGVQEGPALEEDDAPEPEAHARSAEQEGEEEDAEADCLSGQF